MKSMVRLLPRQRPALEPSPQPCATLQTLPRWFVSPPQASGLAPQLAKPNLQITLLAPSGEAWGSRYAAAAVFLRLACRWLPPLALLLPLLPLPWPTR